MESGPTASARTGGASLGKYRLIAELGQGGMADVFLAVVRGPAGFNKLVVVKQIRPSLAQDPEFLAMFLDEARLAARLSHPNVVQTNEVGSDGNHYFIAMEYLEGQPLSRVVHRLGREGAMPLAMHLRVIAEMLAGLHHAHKLCDFDGTKLQVVHRDVTPHNVFITYDGQVKVVDFGIAKAMNSSAETKVGVLKGKVAYMAPEQARGDRVDRRADVFSAGVMLWEVAAGQRLWRGLPDIAVLQRLAHGDIPSPRTVAPDLDPALEAIVMKALAHAREDRHATALDLQTALEAYLDVLGEPVSTRALEKLLAPHFAADRAKIRAIIDQQMRAMSELPTLAADSLPLLDPATGTGTLDRGGDRAGDGARGEISGTSPSFTAPAVAASPEVRRRYRSLVVGAALAGSTTLAAGLWIATRGSTHVGGAPSSPVSAEVVADADAPPPAGSIVLAARTEPAVATATTMSPSPTAHAATSATSVDAGSRRAPSTTTLPPPAPGGDDMKRPAARPTRTLDASNPYGH